MTVDQEFVYHDTGLENTILKEFFYIVWEEFSERGFL
jgi:hypothetical protein